MVRSTSHRYQWQHSSVSDVCFSRNCSTDIGFVTIRSGDEKQKDVAAAVVSLIDEKASTMGATFLVSRRIEQAFSEGEVGLRWFRDLIDQTNDIITIVEPHTARLLGVNASFATITGYSRTELLTMTVIDFEMTIPNKKAWDALVLELRPSGSSILEGELKCRNGTTVPVEANVKYVVQDGDDYMIVVLRDITERKQAEEALRESEQQLSRIYESVGDVLYHLAVEPDDCFRFLSVNRAFLETTGLAEDQIVNKDIEEVIPEPSVSMARGNYKKAIEENRIIRWEETSEFPSGTKVGEVSIAPIFDDNGHQ